MKCAKHQVARLCCRNGRLNRLQIPHLTYQNNVWILSQDTPKGFAETGHINVYLALCNNSVLVVVIKLNWIFYGDNMRIVSLHVDDINHRS